MGIIIDQDGVAHLDDAGDTLARNFAVAAVIAAHQEEFNAAYQRHYGDLLSAEMGRFQSGQHPFNVTFQARRGK